MSPTPEAKSDLEIWLDYGKRMQFKDKDGKSLTPWKTPEEVFEGWQRMWAGRPCDYTGLNYEKLTRDSVIQWPGNPSDPIGPEQLFTDGKFVTDIEYCESFGHDLDTGVPHMGPLSRDEPGRTEHPKMGRLPSRLGWTMIARTSSPWIATLTTFIPAQSLADRKNCRPPCLPRASLCRQRTQANERSKKVIWCLSNQEEVLDIAVGHSRDYERPSLQFPSIRALGFD